MSRSPVCLGLPGQIRTACVLLQQKLTVAEDVGSRCNPARLLMVQPWAAPHAVLHAVGASAAPRAPVCLRGCVSAFPCTPAYLQSLHLR